MVDSSKNNISFNSVNLRMDLDDSSISIERLKTWTPQNFTSILNNPLPQVKYYFMFQYSFYEDIKNKIYSGIYDSTSNLELTDISKDFEKFTDISSPRSHTSSRSSKLSFKELLNESYEDYLKKIKNEFAIYKINHQRKGKNQDLNASRINLVEVDDLSVYQSSHKIYKIIPNDFFNASEFKISKEILEKKRDGIELYCRELIEKCGDVEIEIERILQHSAKLYNYINNNLKPLFSDLNFFYEKVKQMKTHKVFMKKTLLLNSAKQITLGIKKENLKKINQMMKDFKSLKEILDLLRILSKDQSKYQITQDLINKGKDLVQRLKVNSKSPKILKLHAEDFQKLCSKSLDKVQVEFGNVITEILNSLVKFKEIKEIEDDELMIKKFSADYKFDFSNNKNFPCYILSSIDYSETDSLVKQKMKLKELLQIIFNSDNEFYSKLRNILTMKYFEIIVSMKDSLYHLIYKSFFQSLGNEKLQILPVQETEKLDFIFLLTQVKIFTLIQENYENINLFIVNELEESLSSLNMSNNLENKKKEVIIKNYKDELTEIGRIISQEIWKLINSAFSKNLSNCLGHSNIDLFVENYDRLFQLNLNIEIEKEKRLLYGLYSIPSNIYSNSSLSELFTKTQSDYLGMYFQNKNKKMVESIECEDWTAVKIIPSSHQSMLNFICQFNLDSLLKQSREEFLLNLSDHEKFTQEDSSVVKITNINNQVVSFKLVLSTLDLIKVVYDSLKMLTLFDKTISSKLVSFLSNYLNTFILLVKSYILDGEAFRKGRIKRLSQAEVSIANSNACIIRNIILLLRKNNSIFENDFEELLINLDKIRHTCRYNMSDMLNSSIKESIEELVKLDFSSYPVCSEDDKRPLNEWVKKYHKFNPAYSSMIDAFEESEICNTMQEILKIFFDKLEVAMKSLNDKNKLTDSLGQKQFKRDMTGIKKNLKTFKFLGDALEVFQDRTDLITKIVLPKVGKKKTQVEENK